MDSQRIHMPLQRIHRSPIDDQTGHALVLDHHILHGNEIKNLQTGPHSLVNKGGRDIHGIEHIITRRIFRTFEVEFFKQLPSGLLHHDGIEHHAASPNAAAYRKSAFEERHFPSRFGQIISGHQA